MIRANQSIFLFLPLLSGILVFGGAGCVKTVDETAQTVVDGAAGVPLGAYNQAVALTDGERARQHREAEAASNYVTVALVGLEGAARPAGAVLGPEIGCSDQIGYVPVSRVSDSGQVVVDALNTLLSLKETDYGGFHNSLAASSLRVVGPATAGSAGVEIRLEGKPLSGGTCDDPRIRAQIEETIRYFEPNFTIFLNGSESAWRCVGNMSGLCQ